MSSAHACVGTVNVDHHSSEWWSCDSNVNMSSLHQSYRIARSQVRKLKTKVSEGDDPCPELAVAMAEYRKTRKAFKQAVLKAKQMSWEELTASIDNTTHKNRHKLLWSKYKRTVPSSRVPLASFPDQHGAPPVSVMHALNNMASHLSRISNWYCYCLDERCACANRWFNG